MRSKTYMSKINLQRGILTVENRRSREKKRICSEVSVNSYVPPCCGQLSSAISVFSAFIPGIGWPGIGDVRQTVDLRERIVMEPYDNFRWQMHFVHAGTLHRFGPLVLIKSVNLSNSFKNITSSFNMSVSWVHSGLLHADQQWIRP